MNYGIVLKETKNQVKLLKKLKDVYDDTELQDLDDTIGNVVNKEVDEEKSLWRRKDISQSGY